MNTITTNDTPPAIRRLLNNEKQQSLSGRRKAAFELLRRIKDHCRIVGVQVAGVCKARVQAVESEQHKQKRRDFIKYRSPVFWIHYMSK